jgi:multiple sugar transport system substrate-binding protein
MVRIKARMGARQYPILLPTTEWPPPVILGLQTGAPLLREDGHYGSFSDPRFRKAFDFYVGLFNDGLAPKVSGTEVSNLYQEFARGNIAMYISGPWQIGEFTNRLPAESQGTWMTAPLPGPDGPGASMAGGASLVVFRGSKRKTESWQLVEYLSRPEIQRAFHELSGDLPPRRSSWDDPRLAGDPYVQPFRDQLERVRRTPPVPEWERIATELRVVSERAVRRVSAATTPDELAAIVDAAARELDARADEMLDKRRWILDRRAAR